MSLWKIAWRSIQQRALASTLTAVSMGLGVALVVAVLVIHAVVDQSFRRGGEGYDLIVGHKGSRLELVLNSVCYLNQPLGNIPASYRDDLLDGYVEPSVGVDAAIPISMGHSHKGFPVVGTIPEMFEQLTYRDGKAYEFAEGENFKRENPFDGVIGWTAAKETRLKVGDTFKALHGVAEHDDHFTVVGILARTGTPSDRALFVNIDGFSAIHGHDAGESQKSITALLVCINESQPGTWSLLRRKINDGPVAQAVAPRVVIDELFDNIIGNVQIVLLIMAVLIVVVAGMGIMVSIYNSMSDRRHDIAVMRALGANRTTIMAVVLLESILLSLGGGGIGLLLGHGLIGLLSPIIVEETGVAVGLVQFQLAELYLIPGLIVLASLVGYLPAVAAYRTDVARSLTTTP